VVAYGKFFDFYLENKSKNAENANFSIHVLVLKSLSILKSGRNCLKTGKKSKKKQFLIGFY
jgi:hypothetical protein